MSGGKLALQGARIWVPHDKINHYQDIASWFARKLRLTADAGFGRACLDPWHGGLAWALLHNSGGKGFTL
jgi:hypothetical protein